MTHKMDLKTHREYLPIRKESNSATVAELGGKSA
jgi:hypothetical protein